MEALFFGHGAQSPKGTSPFDTLSHMCVMLAIAEEDSFLPIDEICQAILTALQFCESDGDVNVMAARTLGLLLDKFSAQFRILNKRAVAVVTRCLEAVYGLLARRTALRFERTSPAELTEELLKCLTLGNSCGNTLQRTLPGAEAQLAFCHAALDGSKWTSCKVLHHCTLLARAGYLGTPSAQETVERMFLNHLVALTELTIDFEWDELLRTVTEGIITLRMWCGRAAAAGDVQQSSDNAGFRKRLKISAAVPQSLSPLDGSGSPAAVSGESLEELLVAVCERGCSREVASTRKELVLACVEAVVDAEAALSHVSNNGRARMLQLLYTLLEDTAQEIVGFSDPFAPRHQQSPKVKSDRRARGATAAQEDDTFKELANLQWVLPSVQWSALVLLAKFCGANPPLDKDYVWAWRGSGDTYFWYNRKERQALTTSFMRAEREVTLKGGSHVVDLVSLVDMHVATKSMERIHFQPIPYASTYNDAPFGAVVALSSMRVLHQCSNSLDALRRTLRTIAFGSTAVARLAKMVYLHIVCSGLPDSSEDVKAAFRNVVGELPAAVLESLAARLIHEDRQWTGVLVDAGVANALTPSELPSAKRRRTHRSPVAAPRDSPVLRAMRATASEVRLAVAPIELPSSPASLALLLRSTSFAGLLAFFDTLPPGGQFAAQVRDAHDALGGEAEVTAKVVSALSTHVLRSLQELSVEGRRSDLLSAVQEHGAFFVSLCRPGGLDEGGTLCGRGHSLQVHFSSNWACDVCGGRTAYGSMACRTCNYDLCFKCAEVALRRVEVSCTATAGDVLRAWRTRVGKEGGGEVTAGNTENTVLFTRAAVVPAVLPTLQLKREGLHFGLPYAPCHCGVVCPSVADRSTSSGCDGLAEGLREFLLCFGEKVASEAGVRHALFEAMESHGVALFLHGPAGLPPRLRVIAASLVEHLPLAARRDMCRFCAVECRRHALRHIQDAGVPVRGSVLGDISSNGLAFKVVAERDNMAGTVQQLFKAFNQCPSTRTKVEFSFAGEEGIGNGPTQELYAELSRHFRGTEALWYTSGDNGNVRVPFPTHDALHLQEFYVIGAVCARAFVDGYTLDMDLLPTAWPLLSFPEVSSSDTRFDITHPLWAALKELEPQLANSYRAILSATCDDELAALCVDDEEGNPLTVQSASSFVERRVLERLEVSLENLSAFSLGLSTSLDMDAMWLLGPVELSQVLCGASGDATGGCVAPLFSEAQLRAAVLEAHGYAPGCREVAMFVSIVGGEFSREQQRYFLEFLTGSGSLPMSGLAGLGRKITVVRKDMEGGGERTLPSCNTCFLYMKLPPYSTKAIMKERLELAITEGRKNFSLS